MPSNPKGLDRLLRQVASLPKLQTEAAGGVLSQNAHELADKIKAGAPRSKKSHEHLADQIKAEEGAADFGSLAGIKAAAGLVWRVVAPAPGRWVEFGTKARRGDYRDEKGHQRHAGVRGHHATRPHPFFWPVIRAWRKLMHSRMVRASNKAAKAAAAIR